MLCGKKLYGANEKVSPTTGKKCHMTWTCPTGTLQHTSTLSLLVSSSTVHILLSFTLLVLSAGINREKVWWQSCKFASLKRNLNILQSGNMSENLSTNWKLTLILLYMGLNIFPHLFAPFNNYPLYKSVFILFYEYICKLDLHSFQWPAEGNSFGYKIEPQLHRSLWEKQPYFSLDLWPQWRVSWWVYCPRFSF